MAKCFPKSMETGMSSQLPAVRKLCLEQAAKANGVLVVWNNVVSIMHI